MSQDKGRIPQEIIDEIAGQINIVDIVGRYVPLKQRGQNFIGLCPFHNEKTPSFSVSQNKQIFHCFGCNAGGNVFKFLMDIEHLTFPEAVKKLADEVGIKLPEKERSPEEKKQYARRQQLLACNKYAAYFYEYVLSHEKGRAYKEYLEKRGITEDSLKKFQLGACLDGWDHLYLYLKKHHLSDENLKLLGLVSQRNSGNGFYDRFRDRLMFPIHNANGEIVAFGGRIIDSQKAPQKYMNSSDSELFHKGKMVYGLHLAKSEIRAKDQVLIVEGYMDVISCHQAGFSNAIAPLGTALTEDQVKLLLRYSYNFITALDGDNAGQEATFKSLDIIEKLGGRVRVIQFPENLDPDECIKKYGKEYFENLIINAQNSLIFRTEFFKNKMPNQSIDDKIDILYKLLPYLSQLKSSAELETVIAYIAKSLLLSEQSIQSELKNYKRGYRSKESKPIRHSNNEIKRVYSPDEVQLLNLLLQLPIFTIEVELSGGRKLFTEPLDDIFDAFKNEFNSNGHIDVLHLDESLSKIFAAASMQYEKILDFQNEEMSITSGEALIQSLIKKQLESYYQRLLNQIDTLEKGGQSEEMRQVLIDLENIRKRKTELEKKMRGDN